MSPPDRAARALLLATLLVAPGQAAAATWDNVTAQTIGTTAEWSNKVELADVDGDGDLDILFANGGDYSSPGALEPLRVFANDGAGGFSEITSTVFGAARFHARAVKVRDVTGDGVPDVLVAATYQTQSRLFAGDSRGGFSDRSADLPQGALSIGDLELGDVDGDGDLDAMLADWGPGDALDNGGGQPRLWLGDGAGHFSDATSTHMPTLLIGMSWEMELVDVDNDRDLDALIACKVCSGSVLLRNDGDGAFSDASAALPQFGNNYEFEAMDLDGDGLLDLVTINDGPSFTEHVLRGNGTGFTDATSAWWPSGANPAADDNAVAFLDVDSDGDADFLIGSLDGADRVLVNDGSGHLSAGSQTFASNNSPGTLGIAVADLDGDGRLDVVQSQGEAAEPDLVFFGNDLAVDDAAPVILEIAPATAAAIGQDLVIVARINDHRSPVRPTDFQAVELIVTEGGVERSVSMTWYGEYLFRATIRPETDLAVRVCATDAQGNRACTDDRSVITGAAGDDAGPDGGGGPGGDGDGDGGCGCGTRSHGIDLLALVALTGLLLRRRR